MESVERILAPLLRAAEHRAEIVEPGDSFWYHRPQRNFPPALITRPDEHDGSDRMSMACTQIALSSRDQKALVRQWCERLPQMEKVRFLWIHSRVPQELFDAACRMPKLEGLYIKWSGIRSAEALRQARGLRYLHLGSSPSFEPLEVLADLSELVWLELENIRAAADLSFLAALPQLVGLSVTGDTNSAKSIALQTLQPLKALQRLEWLQLLAVTVDDGSLEPIGTLRSLRYLRLANRFAMEEIAKLAGRLPGVQCDLFRAYSGPYDWNRCKKCGQPGMVMPTGKGTPWLCLHCDAARVAKHERAFAAMAKGDGGS